MKTRNTIAIIGLALSLSAPALAQDFSTGSSLMNTGSSYSSPVYGVGATGVDPMGGTTASGPMRRGMTMDSDEEDEDSDWGDVGDFTPIGDAWSLLFFAAAAAGFVALRRRRAANS